MVEEAKYSIIKKVGKIEVRHYSPLIIAKVDGYADEGFEFLFKFISGNNKQKSSIEMTAPVVSEKISMTGPVLSEVNSLSFIMPEGYTLKTTPQPIDDRVKIVELPERNVAVLRFSGIWSTSVFKNKTKELLEEVARAELETEGKVFSMRYNSPFTPWFMRRNEVAIQINP